jgi:hypothetical protein
MDDNRVVGWATFDLEDFQNGRGVQRVGCQSINGLCRNGYHLAGSQQIGGAAHSGSEEIWGVGVKDFSLVWFGQFGNPLIE